MRDSAQVAIIGCGEPIKRFINNGDAIKIIKQIGVTYSVSILQEELPLPDLLFECEKLQDKGAKAFIGVDDDSPHLSTRIARVVLGGALVFGVIPCVTTGRLDLRTILQLTQAPIEQAVAFCGIGQDGLANAIVQAIAVVAQTDENTQLRLEGYLRSGMKRNHHALQRT